MKKQIIVITPPVCVTDEPAICNDLFRSGLQILHLRKPGKEKKVYENFLEQLEPQFLDRVVIHQHYELAEKYHLKGIHIPYREQNSFIGTTIGHISVSCHSLREIETVVLNPAYCFLSPIFDSISKKDYFSGFNQIPEVAGYTTPVMALGGVDSQNCDICIRQGFSGVALLGYIWEKPHEALMRFEKIKTIMDINQQRKHVQYITDHKEGMTIPEQVENVCKGGIRWVQLRMKEASVQEILHEARMVKEICDRYDALFIINDNPEIASIVNADGVHLGKEDISPIEARKILGEGKIIGSTCNTYDDIRKAITQKADYIGLGPFRFTTTKKKLSPVLGLEGYRNIISQMKKDDLYIPIYAIGGIEEPDILPLMQTGIQGIAVSGLIKNSVDMVGKTKRVLGEL